MSEPITRDQVLSIVKRHLIETIDGLTDETIDSAQTLGDIGARSIDIVEVVSCSMRDLKIKVPRSELMLLDSLDELVDLLHKHAVQKAQASCSQTSESGPS